MATGDMIEGVRRLVACAGPQAGEEFVILTDDGFPAHIVERFREVLLESDVEVTVVQMHRGQNVRSQPTNSAAGAIGAADVVIELTTEFVQHSTARQEGQARGLRYVFIGDIDDAMLAGPGAVYADFAALSPRIEAIAGLVTKSSRMRLTSKAGTDITVSTVGRPGRALTGLAVTPGTFGAPPCLEAGVIPVRGTANGKVVVDAYCVGIGLISEPFEVIFENGRAVSISGSAQGAQLQQILEAANEFAFDACEIGIGLNDRARMIDNVTSAEACYGTAHVAVGTTPADPGIEIVHAGLHIDMVFHEPTITIDDETVMVDGVLEPRFLSL